MCHKCKDLEAGIEGDLLDLLDHMVSEDTVDDDDKEVMGLPARLLKGKKPKKPAVSDRVRKGRKATQDFCDKGLDGFILATPNQVVFNAALHLFSTLGWKWQNEQTHTAPHSLWDHFGPDTFLDIMPEFGIGRASSVHEVIKVITLGELIQKLDPAGLSPSDPSRMAANPETQAQYDELISEMQAKDWCWASGGSPNYFETEGSKCGLFLTPDITYDHIDLINAYGNKVLTHEQALTYIRQA